MQATSTLQHQSVYQIVTEQIIKQLESGVAPWHKPWRTEPPCNLVSGQQYRGINVFLLATQGYGSRYWLTLNQANRLGGHIRKGERSSIVTFWKMGDEKTTTDETAMNLNRGPFCCVFTAFLTSNKPMGLPISSGWGAHLRASHESTNVSASSPECRIRPQ